MNYKKSLLAFCLILCVLFSISAANAIDIDDKAITSEDTITEEANEDELTSSSKNVNELTLISQEDSLTEIDNGTFTALQNKINNAEEGSTITLENDYVYDDGFDSEGINISKSLTIDGKGFTIDALNKSRIFYISDNPLDIVLKNIEFCNGNTNSLPGGAIFIYGGAMNQCGNVVNCSFVGNSANDENGGAIYKCGNVVNCSFVGNSARHGGAIYLCNDVMNCSFVGNSVEEYGVSAIFGFSNVVNCSLVIYYIY